MNVRYPTYRGTLSLRLLQSGPQVKKPGNGCKIGHVHSSKMKFYCANCNRRMKSEGATTPGRGKMSVASFCPNCGSRFALLVNAGDTLFLRAVNAGPAGQELMAQTMKSAKATITTHEVEQTAISGSTSAASWREMAEEWVWIEPGRFVMGSPESEPGRDTDEGPQHEVAIGRGFYLGKYTITCGQWEEVMGTTPWLGRGSIPSSPTLPAGFISWNDVQDFASRLNEAGGARYRLPFEAEWEYACRAGTTTVWSFGEDRHALGDHAWYVDSDAAEEDQSGQEVGRKLPNPWGLHDMHGNVWEWCQDVYSDGYYADSPAVDPPGPQAVTGSTRVVRGGYFRYFPRHSRSAARNTRWPDDRQRTVGARLVRTPDC